MGLVGLPHASPKRTKAVKVRKKGCSCGITINFHRAEGTFILILTAAKPHSSYSYCGEAA
jgi:hypothetical protein